MRHRREETRSENEETDQGQRREGGRMYLVVKRMRIRDGTVRVKNRTRAFRGRYPMEREEGGRGRGGMG